MTTRVNHPRPAVLRPAAMLAVATLCAATLRGMAPPPQTPSAMEQAAKAITPVLEKVQPLLQAGRQPEANAQILATFPEPRTPEQQLVLGNVLFRQDMVASYRLHKEAAARLPNSDEAQFEWALEQHRAREWQGAAQSYQQFLSRQPDYAGAHALLAECWLRLGETSKACQSWGASDKAGSGTLVAFESMVCEVHSGPLPDGPRAALIARIQKGDLGAAAELITLDSAWQTDWWNSDLREDNLDADMQLIRAQNFPPSRDLDAVLCAGDAARAKTQTRVRECLLQHRFLVDTDASLPDRGDLLEVMLNSALQSGVWTTATARATLGEKILAKAAAGKDAACFNAAAHLYLDQPDRLAAIDLQGWDQTGDARFAASRIAGLMSRGLLAPDHPELARALKEFPDNAVIQGVALQLQPTTPNQARSTRLTAAILAEYSGFSTSGLVPRPSARKLQQLFTELISTQNK